MKKHIYLLSAALSFALTFSLASCEGKGPGDEPGDKPVVVHPETVSVSPSELLDMMEGESRKLVAEVSPDNAEDKSVTWSSDDPTVADVDGEGNVTALKGGTTTITATCADGGAFATVPVEVTPYVAINMDRYRLPVGDVRRFTANILHPDYSGGAVVWSSDAEDVATVSQEGVVTAHKEGTANIVATVDGFEAECVITVIPAPLVSTLGTPDWGEYGLGIVGFVSDRTWIVGEQEWSDAVVASACDKETFDSGGYPAYKSACRNNGDYGHLFSWPAVYRFQSEICPDGWRVPSREDYIALDLFWGGTGEYEIQVDEYINAHYLNPEVWGGEASGYCGNGGQLKGQGTYAGYWTASEDGFEPRYGGSFYVFEGAVAPRNMDMKYIGFPVRCVRDVE
ncbi:MAG: Ig-like domain-containing protein [Alistipes sp.]|jgi:uncharacterized protein (TIGR02145 family)|nr:Ig-like domain-containing protein [Alistipes sp.]